MELVEPVFVVGEVVRVFLSLDHALRHVELYDVPDVTAYDAEGRFLALQVEGRLVVLDEQRSGEHRPEELRAHLVRFGSGYGPSQLGVDGDLDALSLPELVEAYVRTFTLRDHTGPPTFLILGLAALLVAVLLLVVMR